MIWLRALAFAAAGLAIAALLDWLFDDTVAARWLAGFLVAYALLQKFWPSSLSATARLAAICLGGVASLLPFAAWELLQPGLTVWGWQAAGIVLMTALLPGLGAYWIYGWSQRVLGASRVAMTLYLGPLYGGIAAWIVLGEAPGWHHLGGAALILPGVFLVTSARQPPTAKRQ